MDHAKDPQQHPTDDPHASEPDRRRAERRQAERRQLMSFGGRRLREDRRKRDRRLKLAGAGLLAAAALAAGGHEMLAKMGPSSIGFGAPGEPTASVDVNTDFHLPAWDKAALEPFIQEAAALHNLPAALIRAVIQQESRFNPLAVSRVGAQGLMQLMPETARRVGIENPFDPRENILGGTKYLRSLLERFNGNTAKAVAAYNAGPTQVARRGGIPPFRETQGYVRNIQKMVAGTDAAFSLPAGKVRKVSLRTQAGAHKASRAHGHSKSVVRKASTTRRPLVRRVSMRATRARRGSRV